MSKGPSLRVRLIIYPFIAILFILAMYIITLNAIGFNVYFRNGKLVKEKTGAMIIATRPGDAEVVLDGNMQKKKTPLLNLMSMQIKRLKAGPHHLIIKKEGYTTWEGNIHVKPGMVNWLNQIILIPIERKPQSYNLPAPPSQSLASADGKKMIIKIENKRDQIATFWLVDLTTKETKKLFEYTSQEGDFRPISFATNNNRLLFKKALNNKISYVVYDAREKSNFWDISDIFKLDFDQIIFNPRDHNQLYILRSGNLHLLNYLDKNMSAVLANDIENMFTESDNLYLIKIEKDKKSLVEFTSEKKELVIINKLPDSKYYTLRNLGKLGYVLYAQDKKELFYYKLNNDPYQSPVLIAADVEKFLPSPGNQFMGYYDGKSLKAFEVEKNEYYQFLVGESIKSINWLYDQFHLVYIRNNELRFVTYFGAYDLKLFGCEEGLPVFVSPSSPRIYFFAKNPDTNNLDLYVYDP